jgi:hypothetical protein
MKKFNFLFFSAFLALMLWGFTGVNSASAYVVEDLHLATQGSIIVGPGKTEVLLSPGDTYNFEFAVTNVSGMTKVIKLTAEDANASADPTLGLEFLGTEKGPYSIKDFIIPEISEVTLLNGQRLRVPITISIPADAEPGGLYGALMAAAYNIDQYGNVESGTAAGQVNIVTRVASLLFVRVKGDALTSGFLKNFYSDENFYEAGPVNFKILSENTGNIHLNPYGLIQVKDMLGRLVDSREVDPWFVMPKSDRVRSIAWNSNFLIGRYTATLSLNRGYQDIVDSMSYSFWVIPWKIIAIVVIGLILIIWFFVWLLSHIQWKKKPSNSVPPPNVNPPAPPVYPQNP